MESGKGTVIRLTKLTDSSLIVHWMTEEAGLIKTVAKGARRKNSGFAGRLDLFLEADIEWVRRKRAELHFLSEVSVTDYRESLRKSYRDSLVAGYFGQLLELVLESDHVESEIFDLLKRGLNHLCKEGASRRAMLHFEKEVARILGLGKGAHIGILQVYGKLPKSRDHCLDLLPQT